jgi:glycosyltransferase involved in cell wall biosynthesis
MDVDAMERPSKVVTIETLHVVASLAVGGMEGVIFDLARLATRPRFNPRVLCLEEVGPWGERFERAGIAVEGLGGQGRHPGMKVLLLARRLRALGPDVVHTHNVKAHLQGTLAARLAGISGVVHTKHGHVFPESALARWANRIAVSHCRRVVAVSADTARRAIEVEGLPPGKVEVIHNGVDLAAFAPLGEGPVSPARAIHVARLSEEKDQATLLRAARLVADQRPEFHLEVVGDGPDRPELAALAAALSLDPHVSFLGARTDVPVLLRASGLFVLSSRSEGISLTLLEAMASGLPVVATDVGGNAEVVVHGETGVLVPAGDPARLAEAVAGLLSDPERAHRLGRAGRRRVERAFDLRGVVRRYEQLYEDVLTSIAPARFG